MPSATHMESPRWEPLRRPVACLMLAASVLVAFPAAAAAAPPDRAALARMDRVIADGMEASGIPGFAIAVVADGRTVHARGFGDAGDGRRVTPRTPFLLGSVAKSFTALAAMQLVDAGKLELDAPVRRYVPEFQLADPRAADRITVRHVLQQTSGLPETAGGPIVKSAAEGTALEALAELRDTRPSTPPGSAFEYSNANFILAGLTVERASGEPCARYIERHIFAPLGMRDSYVTLDAARRGGLAVGHRYWFGRSVAHGPTFRAGIQSAGYLVSSAEDMARYLAIYLNDGVAANGRRIVSWRGLQTMLAPARAGKLGPWADHVDTSYAMGWYVGGPWAEPARLHPGRAPDSSSMIAVFPRRGLAVVTLTNAANQLAVPGYPAPIDRVERNAIDALIGEPVITGVSLQRVYLYFDIVVLALLAAACRRAAAIAGVLARAGAGLALAAFPAVTLGWSTWLLWQPDVALVLAPLSALLLATAALRLAVLVRRAPRQGEQPRAQTAERRASVHA